VSDAPDFIFKCTFCRAVIPHNLTPADLSLPVAEPFVVGALYPYENWFCGFGTFVVCESARLEAKPGAPAPAAARILSDTSVKVGSARYAALPLSQVHPNPKQPRKFFDGEALRGLAESIRTVGLLEDILVRPDGDGYEIVLGERRWRASQLAGAATISAKIVDLSDAEVASIAITENVQRENMSEVEEAFAFKQYIDAGGEISTVGREFGGLQERIADRLKLLNSHHFVEYQEERIEELTSTVAKLRAQLKSGGARYEARIVEEADLVAALIDGFEVAATLPVGRLALRRAGA
jgi:ParB family chromosome partitioning protein